MAEKKEGKHFWDKKKFSTQDEEGFKETDEGKVASKLGSMVDKKISYKIERIPSGIEGLDNIIEGGLRKNTNVLIEGGAGCGKSIFCMQF
ncbi:MAG: RAD55 family ATPase, partial [Candidatus Woesearchaeota archaeon]